MNQHITRFGIALSGAALLAAGGCGGGDDTPVVTPPVAATTDVATTVVDGAIRNALVCVDKNANMRCDADETQGRTDAAGKVTLAVPNDDLGKYPIVAVVGTDAVDADHGAVTVAYTMATSKDQTAVVSPLTTLVQQTVVATGASSADAAKSIQAATGITASLFQDYTQAAAPADGTVSAATVARLLVVTSQQQSTAIASALGATAADGGAITQAMLDTAVRAKLLELLPDLVTALADPAVQAATSAAEKEVALLAAANSVLKDSGLAVAAVPTVVAINNQIAAPATPASAAPTASGQLNMLTFTDASNYYVRLLTGSVAQNTPDAANTVRFVDRRLRASGGVVAKWGAGSDPWRQADLHWNGTSWAACALNHENVSSVRDAQGRSSYDYCDKQETGNSVRASFDVAGKTMADVYAQIRAAGYTNLTIKDPAVLGTTAFPAGSMLLYQTTTPLTEAIAYYPAGATSAVGTSNVVSGYSPSISGGGVASSQPAGTACNTPNIGGTSTNTTTLESLIATRGGTPCVFGPGSFTYGGVQYTGGAVNEWWGQSTVSLGKLGNAPVNSGDAPGYYTSNTLLRIAFKGTGSNPVTYYACKERFNNGGAYNCAVIGTGSYTITTLGDGRAMTFSNPPAQAAPLTYNRVFVERGGFVYFGYQGKPNVNNTARFNTTGSNALLAQLGVATEDPSTPLALTAASYQGTWDLTNALRPTELGTAVFVNGGGGASCQDRQSASFYACTLTITDPLTGAFTLVDDTLADNLATGTFNFIAGTASGAYHDPTANPVDGNFIGARR